MAVIHVRRASLSLFLLAMSVLALEISLTRIFSVMTWHHFAYLIISLALLGFGAAGSLLTVSRRFSDPHFDDELMGRYALAFCLTSMLGFAAATKVRFYPIDAYIYGDYSNVFSLLMLYIILGTPFFFAGVCIGYLISKAGDAINRLYFADLFGAGTGALLSIAGINYLGAEATIYAAATAGGLVALIYAVRGKRWWLRFGSATALSLCLLMTIVAQRHEIFPVYFPPEKIFRDALTPHYYRWHAVARVDVGEPITSPNLHFGGTLSSRYADDFPKVRLIFQDGAAPTGIINLPDRNVQTLPMLGYYLQGAPYVIKRNPRQALVIGVGGGLDVLIALYNGAERVVGVEVNPVTVDAVTQRYADFAGRIFNRPDVEMITAEGRHYLTSTDEHFDVIQLSGVDTYSALSLGAYAVAENYLYTVEAMEDYWEHLTQDGVLSFSRWLFTPPRETLRLVATQVETLRQMGIEEPSRHLMVIAGRHSEQSSWWADTLLKKRPFSEAEAAVCRQWAGKLQFEILYDPYRNQPNVFNRLIRASDSERAAMLSSYVYNIQPTTDDNPFFFQFYRWRSLLRTDMSEGGYFFERFPLGLAVLLVSLVQIFVLSGAFIIVPLLARGSPLRQVAYKSRILVYFAALGVGFIGIEISLLQKYSIFVGGPVYSMAVTLFSILVFSGIGSLLAQQLTLSLHRSLTLIIVMLVAVIIAEAIFVNFTIPHLMFLSHAFRCAAAIAGVAPLGLLMGMPFPTGLRVAQRIDQAVIPWAWGVNAVTTTMATMLCVTASMQWGFTVSLLAAGAFYLVGLASLKPVARAVSQ